MPRVLQGYESGGDLGLLHRERASGLCVWCTVLEAWGITIIRPEGCEPRKYDCCRHGDCKNADGCCEHGPYVSTRLSLPSDIALEDVPDRSKIGRYGVRPAEEIRDMLAAGLLRKVMQNDMVYGYLAVPAVPTHA